MEATRQDPVDDTTSHPQEIPDHSESLMLMVGVGASVLAYFLPALVFEGMDHRELDVALAEELPVMTVLAIAALVAALAARFMPKYQHRADQASVIAVIVMVVPALWSFVSSVYSGSVLNAEIVRMAGTQQVWIDPGPAFGALLVGGVLLMLSLRARRRKRAEADVAA